MQTPAIDTKPFDPVYFAHKHALFERVYNHQAAEGLINLLGNRFQPEVEITFEDVRKHYPHLLTLAVDEPELEAFVERYLTELQPFCQAPFLLPGHRVTQGPWLGDYKLGNFPLCDVTHDSVAGKRVLDIGCNAGFDTYYLSTLDPCEVVGVEPAALFYYQALLLWSIYYCPNLRFVHAGWESIHPEAFGRFDLVNCQGILYHEPSPMVLLERIFDLLAPGGKLVLETHVTLDSDMKALFVEGAFWGDHNWFWITSVDATLAMLRVCGFEDVQLRSGYPVPSKNPNDELRTVEGIPVGGRAFFTANRPRAEHVFRVKYGR